MREGPFSYHISLDDRNPTHFDNHIIRSLSSMEGYFYDEAAYSSMLAEEDQVLYEVFEIKRPETVGELLQGISVIRPGKVGNEYFMTKGHFHKVLDTSEVYYCLRGHGLMLMETPEGEWALEEMKLGTVVYVPPRWGHRSINLHPDQELILFFAYPAHAGHDYKSIEERGFRKLVVERNGKHEVVENERWDQSS